MSAMSGHSIQDDSCLKFMPSHLPCSQGHLGFLFAGIEGQS